MKNASYDFKVSGDLTDTQTVQSENIFKRDPGFAGIVTDSNGNPVQGVKVHIYGPDGSLHATVYTDEDGWYFYSYKHTGKAATYTIKLPEHKLQQSVTLKQTSWQKSTSSSQHSAALNLPPFPIPFPLPSHSSDQSD